MRVPVSIRTSYFMADKKALVDSGATDNFMHPAFAKRMGLGLQELPNPKKIFNIDNVTCRWHVRLDVREVRSVANSL
jgi:predicted aspartyl protease